MNVPYLMQLPEQDELWIVDGERRFLITPQVYDLIVGNGGELPPAYGIEKLQDENAKLRELLLDCWDFSHLMHQVMAARFYELGLIDDGEARELGVEVWS